MYYVFVCSMGSLIFCIFRRFYCYILKDLNKRLWTTIALLYYSGLEFCSSCKCNSKVFVWEPVLYLYFLSMLMNIMYNPKTFCRHASERNWRAIKVQNILEVEPPPGMVCGWTDEWHVESKFKIKFPRFLGGAK